MRIALYHNLTSGGSKREAFEFAKQLVSHGHEIDLHYPATADEKYLPLDGVVKKQYQYPFQLQHPTSFRIPLLRKYLDLYKELSDIKRIQKLSKQIAENIDSKAYEFVFLHHDLIVQSPYLLKYLKTPSVYYCNEPMREFYEPMIVRQYQSPPCFVSMLQRAWYSPADKIKKRIIKSEDLKNVCDAGLLLTNSFFAAESIYKAYGLRAQVSYLGVDVKKFIPLNRAKRNRVLSVGAVSPLKGYDFLIEAIGFIPEFERPELCIVGNTASEGEMIFLRRLAKEKGVAIEFRVNVTEDELVLLYNEAKAFVYSPVMEPFGFAPLEAMACGIPVVAVKEGGVRESVIDGITGLLAPRIPGKFAETLQSILTDEQLSQKMGKQGRQEILRFWTWEHAYRRFIEEIDDFLMAKGSSRK